MKEAVCLLVSNNDGDILAVSRKNDPNDFGLPGGTVEPGESNVQALIRETKEETGLDITNIQVAFISFCGDYETTTYVGNISGDIKTNEDGVVDWVSMDTLMKGSFGKYNRDLFKFLRYI